MQDKLKELGLNVRWSDDPDREVIDFSIDDGTDNVAWVWGSNPFNDVQIECNHPEEAIDYNFGKDHHQGRCEICGAWCDVRTHTNYDDGYRVDEPYAEEWYIPNRIGGIVGEYLEELRKEF